MFYIHRLHFQQNKAMNLSMSYHTELSNLSWGLTLKTLGPLSFKAVVQMLTVDTLESLLNQ